MIDFTVHNSRLSMYSVLLRDNMPNSFIEPTKRTRFEKKPSVCLFRRRKKGCVLGLYSCDCNTFFSDLQYTILLYTLINMKNITYFEAQTILTFSDERSNTRPISIYDFFCFRSSRIGLVVIHRPHLRVFSYMRIGCRTLS